MPCRESATALVRLSIPATNSQNSKFPRRTSRTHKPFGRISFEVEPLPEGLRAFAPRLFVDQAGLLIERVKRGLAVDHRSLESLLRVGLAL